MAGVKGKSGRKPRARKKPIFGVKDYELAKRGRPTEYRPEYHDERAFNLSLLGLTDEQMAGSFEIAPATFAAWKVKYSSFREALKSGREDADGKVVASLHSRALGFEHDSEKIVTLSEGAGGGSYVERVPIKVKYAPDPVAAIFWLKNRRPDLWRDKRETELSGKDGQPIAPVLNVTLTKPDDE